MRSPNIVPMALPQAIKRVWTPLERTPLASIQLPGQTANTKYGSLRWNKPSNACQSKEKVPSEPSHDGSSLKQDPLCLPEYNSLKTNQKIENNGVAFPRVEHEKICHKESEYESKERVATHGNSKATTTTFSDNKKTVTRKELPLAKEEDWSKRAEAEPVAERRGSRKTSVVEAMALQLVSIATKMASEIYCPLCVNHYLQESHLRLHLVDQHQTDLKLLLKKEYDVFVYQTCPACNVRIFKRGLLAYHIMKFHPEAIAALLSSVALERGRAKCQFCNYIVSEDLLSSFVDHLQLDHADQIENLLLDKMSNHTMSSVSLKSSEMSLLLTKGSIRDSFVSSAARRKSILRMSPGPNVRRKGKTVQRSLRFSVPESTLHLYTPPQTDSSASTSNTINSTLAGKLNFDSSENLTQEPSAISLPSGLHVETVISYDTPPKSRLLCGVRKRKTQKVSTPMKVKSPLRSMPVPPWTPGRSPVRHYQCIICHLDFGSNLLLLQHVRNWHSMVFHRPRFGCASCGAKFFKNKFLLKHTQVCHTIQQIMNSSVKTPKVVKCKLDFSGAF